MCLDPLDHRAELRYPGVDLVDDVEQIIEFHTILHLLYRLFLYAVAVRRIMPEKTEIEDREEKRKNSPYGGLEDLTEEEILENIKRYPYVMNKLKDC